MEVAGQWRREWAGTAEYGKVTEGGVTRRVARAMEVLQASGPGSRMRVLRAAYHSTTGSGAPAESFVMHSSRRVISSGSNFLDSPAFMSKPLEISSKPFEISSTPLESSPERLSESENYKVTEPDDTEISEPSKWRNSTGKSLRMPSEESSSTADNASIIDLDPRMNIMKHTGLLRKYSFDSDSSEIQPKHQSYKRNCNRESPLLDTPVTLSTLKYKSLLNGSNENWNDRRKSYSFEDTAPLSETILHKNDTLAMESSTDSGICKSTEIVNENSDEKVHHIHINKTDATYEPREGTFKEWLARNRHYRENSSKPLRENYIIEEPVEDKITLQSTGKVSIALPINNQIDDRIQYIKNHINGEIDRRIKKVEFCKTELHFAAESGKVNIIATDEKPPPTNDFRRRRSAFVPIKDTFHKPVTLFGEKQCEFPHSTEFDFHELSDIGDSDENTAATKSILKNKIPKPKPYLLGENMVFGQEMKSVKGDCVNSQKELIIPTAVSIINKQLQPEEKKYDELASFSDKNSENKIKPHPTGAEKHNVFRPTNEGPLNDTAENSVNSNFQRFNSERNSFREDFNRYRNEVIETNNTNSVKQKLRNLQKSPVMQVNSRTRKLRESELTYFGIESLNKRDREKSNNNKQEDNKWKNKNHKSIQIKPDNELQSVKLIQRVSNSVCNSEADSDETPEYQNIPVKSNFAPVPLPRTRTKGISDLGMNLFDNNNSEKVVIIKPAVERSYQVSDSKAEQETRRTRRRQDISTTSSKFRSISEPPKHGCKDLINKTTHNRSYQRRIDNIQDVVPLSQSSRCKQKHVVDDSSDLKYPSEEDQLPEHEALYVNLNVNKEEESIKPTNSPKKTSEYTSNRRSRKLSTERREKKIYTYGGEDNQDQNLKSVKSKTSRHTNSKDKHNYDNKCTTDSDTMKSKKPKDSRHKEKKHTEIIPSSFTPDEVELRIVDKSPIRDVKQLSKSSNKQTHSGSLDEPNEGKYNSNGKKSTRVAENTDRDTKVDAKKIQRRDRSKSKDNSERQDKVKTSERQYSHQSPKHGGIDTDSSTKPAKHKRSEYVINYDDKNGTVSSICKVKPGASKKIIIHPEKTNESKSKTKSSVKTTHLQYQDQQWIRNGSFRNGDKKRKSIVHMQRNCQLL